MSDNTLVKFTKTNMPYRKGDVAGFRADVAKSFIDAGVAEQHGAKRAPREKE